MNVRLSGTFELLSPLSHIGETASTTAYLVQEPLLQPDGALAEVFCYSGNALRGHLRDLAASYMLDAIGASGISLDGFHLLFSGGRIGGPQSVDIDRARTMRRAIPMLAMWGGGVGNQILAGKLRVGNCYPICREAIPALPKRLHERAAAMSYRGMSFEKSFSRKDDGKDERLHRFLPSPDAAGGNDDGASGKPATKPTRRDDGPADQMRMTVELLAVGVSLYTWIDVLDASDAELGALVSALHSFSRSPHIGGQANKGHGRVALHYDLMDLDSGETLDFLTISDDSPIRLAPPAAAAKASYDQHLREIYDAKLQERKPEIIELIGC